MMRVSFIPGVWVSFYAITLIFFTRLDFQKDVAEAFTSTRPLQSTSRCTLRRLTMSQHQDGDDESPLSTSSTTTPTDPGRFPNRRQAVASAMMVSSASAGIVLWSMNPASSYAAVTATTTTAPTKVGLLYYAEMPSHFVPLCFVDHLFVQIL